MKKSYTSAFVIIPPQQIWSSIQDLRKKYDRQFNRWMPHITLLYPFIPEVEFNLITKAFVYVCQNHSPFEIVLREFDYFNHGKQHYTIWIKPSPSNLIIELQYLFLEVVPGCNDVNLYRNGFVPHLSVGQINGTSQMFSILSEIRNNWTELRFLLNQVYFIACKHSKSSKFEIIKTISLR